MDKVEEDQQQPLRRSRSRLLQRHTADDVRRVRAALAEVGYPNPSEEDIEGVFEQIALRHAAPPHQQQQQMSPAPWSSNGAELPYGAGVVDVHGAGANGGRGQSWPIPASPYAPAGGSLAHPEYPPQQHEPYPLPPYAHADPSDDRELLHYLDPSLRLQRYIQQRERELEAMCLRPAAAVGSGSSAYATAPPPVPLHPHTPQRGTRAEAIPVAYGDERGDEGRALAYTQDTAAVAAAPPLAARVQDEGVFDDEFFKADTNAGRPTARTSGDAHVRTRQVGSARPGAAYAAAAAAPVVPYWAQQRRAANIVFDATGDQRFRFFPSTRVRPGTGTLAPTTPVPRSTSASYATAWVGSAPPRRPSPAAPATSSGTCSNAYQCARTATSGLSGGQVTYLDPAGRTLRRRPADPVRRGQQMRLLWAQDAFLTQRHRSRESWRTRQITMTYNAVPEGLDRHHHA